MRAASRPTPADRTSCASWPTSRSTASHGSVTRCPASERRGHGQATDPVVGRAPSGARDLRLSDDGKLSELPAPGGALCLRQLSNHSSSKSIDTRHHLAIANRFSRSARLESDWSEQKETHASPQRPCRRAQSRWWLGRGGLGASRASSRLSAQLTPTCVMDDLAATGDSPGLSIGVTGVSVTATRSRRATTQIRPATRGSGFEQLGDCQTK
jgi:hypothetical protein